jgi:hypothetical protein
LEQEITEVAEKEKRVFVASVQQTFEIVLRCANLDRTSRQVVDPSEGVGGLFQADQIALELGIN